MAESKAQNTESTTKYGSTHRRRPSVHLRRPFLQPRGHAALRLLHDQAKTNCRDTESPSAVGSATGEGSRTKLKSTRRREGEVAKIYSTRAPANSAVGDGGEVRLANSSGRGQSGQERIESSLLLGINGP